MDRTVGAATVGIVNDCDFAREEEEKEEDRDEGSACDTDCP
jgi:hypothetical protein